MHIRVVFPLNFGCIQDAINLSLTKIHLTKIFYSFKSPTLGENPNGESMRFLPNFGREGIQYYYYTCIGVVKIFGGGYTFLVFYCIFINKFCKNFGGRVHFYPPPSPPLPLWASMSPTNEKIMNVFFASNTWQLKNHIVS